MNAREAAAMKSVQQDRFDIEHAKERARNLVFSCDLTPSRLRELFPEPQRRRVEAQREG